jgi:hypothetical protein
MNPERKIRRETKGWLEGEMALVGRTWLRSRLCFPVLRENRIAQNQEKRPRFR